MTVGTVARPGRESDVDAELRTGEGAGGPHGRHVDWGRRAALHYLERWASSEANLARVLKRKLRRRAALDPDRWSLAEADAEALVATVLSGCRDLGLLDDHAYAQTKVAGGRRRGHSASRIRATMAAKGVPREITEDVVGAGAEPDEERAALVFARKRRLGPFRRDDGEAAVTPSAGRSRCSAARASATAWRGQ